MNDYFDISAALSEGVDFSYDSPIEPSAEKNVNITQNNYSPKALSEFEAERNLQQLLQRMTIGL